ncbi:MAG: hypothetical protein L3K26_02790 [Candidatus Hydrogenedentes bacterium]|nr:hypothetical protein [Candidatus Hydrogenedentota bacterium]
METVEELIEAMCADAVAIAQDNFDVALDYSPASVEIVEEMLGGLHEAFKSKEGLEDAGQLACCFGAYVGECIRRANSDASWCEEIPKEGFGYLVVTWRGQQCFTLGWCNQRITEGPEFDVWDTFKAMLESVLTKE